MSELSVEARMKLMQAAAQILTDAEVGDIKDAEDLARKFEWCAENFLEGFR